MNISEYSLQVCYCHTHKNNFVPSDAFIKFESLIPVSTITILMCTSTGRHTKAWVHEYTHNNCVISTFMSMTCTPLTMNSKVWQQWCKSTTEWVQWFTPLQACYSHTHQNCFLPIHGFWKFRTSEYKSILMCISTCRHTKAGVQVYTP